MAIPTWSPSIFNSSKLDLNYGGEAFSGGFQPAASAGEASGGGVGVGMYMQAAQAGFNAIFGAITKPKAAKLQAAQVNAQAEMNAQEMRINAKQLDAYRQDLTENALTNYLNTMDYARNFTGSQKAVMSAQGIWGGSTFDMFINDTVNKTVTDIATRSKEVSRESAKIRLQADVLRLQATVEEKVGQSNAQSIKAQGKASGILSLFGLG